MPNIEKLSGNIINCDSQHYIYAEDTDFADVKTGSFSLSIWVKLNSITGTQALISKYGLTPVRGYAMFLSNGKIQGIIASAGNAAYTPLDGTQLTLDEWHHVAITFDRLGYMTRYLDGVQDGSQTAIVGVSGTITNEYYFMMGANTLGFPFAGYVDGYISEAQISIDTCWSAAEVLYQYQHRGVYVRSGGYENPAFVGLDLPGEAYLFLSDADSDGLFDPGTYDFSISGWIKKWPPPAVYAMIMRKFSGTGYGIYLTSAGRLMAYLNGGTGSVYSVNDGGNICNNSWNHFAVTFDRDGYLRRYVNGAPYGSNADISSTAGNINTSAALVIGNDNLFQYEFNGEMFDIKFNISEHGGIWTPGQIAYQARFKNLIDDRTGNVTAAWNMQDESGEMTIVNQAGGKDLYLIPYPSSGISKRYGDHYFRLNDGSGTTVSGASDDIKISNAAGWDYELIEHIANVGFNYGVFDTETFDNFPAQADFEAETTSAVTAATVRVVINGTVCDSYVTNISTIYRSSMLESGSCDITLDNSDHSFDKFYDDISANASKDSFVFIGLYFSGIEGIMYLYSGIIDDVVYKNFNVIITCRDKMAKVLNKAIGSGNSVIDYYSAGYSNPADLAWTILTTHGLLDSSVSEANKDIDYASWKYFRRRCEVYGYRIKARFAGTQIGAALLRIAQMLGAGAAIYQDGNGRFAFSLFEPQLTYDLSVLDCDESMYGEDFKLDIDPGLVKNNIYISYNYDPDYAGYQQPGDPPSAWENTVNYSDSDSITVYGYQDVRDEDRVIWHSRQASANSAAENRLLAEKNPKESVNLILPREGLILHPGNTISVSNDHLSISAKNYWIEKITSLDIWRMRIAVTAKEALLS